MQLMLVTRRPSRATRPNRRPAMIEPGCHARRTGRLGARPRLRMAWLVLLSLGWLLAGESLAEAQQARPAGKEPSATEPVDLNRLP